MNANARFWLLLAAAIVVFVLLTAGSGGSDRPFSPRSVEPDGAKGIVEVLEDLGADVRIGQPLPQPGDTAALMLEDRLRPDDRDELSRWISQGGVLVVADPFSTYLPTRVEPLPDEIANANCAIDALREVKQLELPPDAWSLETDSAPACFGSNAHAFVVATPVDNGAIVSVGSRQLFTNQWLDDADTAVLAVSLLAPDPQASSVAFLGPSLVEFGDEDVDVLIATRVRNAILMLGVAFALYAIHRARRLGAVVHEPLPVHLHGSEVVLQAGLLSERAADPGGAAEALRSALLSRARGTLALHPGDSQAKIAEAIAHRLHRDGTEIQHVFFSPVTTDAELLDVAQELTTIERTLFNPNQLAASATGAARQNPA